MSKTIITKNRIIRIGLTPQWVAKHWVCYIYLLVVMKNRAKEWIKNEKKDIMITLDHDSESRFNRILSQNVDIVRD